MKEKLGRLKLLQAVDQVLDGLQKQKDELPAELGELEQDKDKQQATFDALSQELDDLTSTKARRELDQSEENDRVKKYESRLKDLKTNREYQALLREIGFAKKASSELADEIVRLGEAIDAKKAEVEEAQTLLNEMSETLSSKRSSVEKALSEVGKEYEGEARRREELLGEIPNDLLSRYNLVRRRTNLVVVEAKSGACTGCFMSLPPQLFNQVRRNDKIYTCPNCHRILTYEAPAEAVGA